MMRSSIWALYAACAPLINAFPSSPKCYRESAFAAEDIIERDVLIVGGGATGTYAAVSLKDEGKTFAIVERSDRLGGHVDTLTDLVGGAPIDYGVQAYIDNSQTRNFFGRFNVSLVSVGLSPLPSNIVDFQSGFTIPNATAPNPMDLMGPLANFLFSTFNFPGLAEGAYDLPDPVPEDLYLPFGNFVAKYNLTEVVPVVWIFAHGVGNLLEMPTLYVLQNFGQPHLLGLQTGYLAAPGGNQEVYDKAAAFLGDDVFYESTVLQTSRSNGTTVVVKTPTGHKLIKANKLLITVPPTVKNLAGFDLDEAEMSVFNQWNNVPYYVGVVNNTGLPDLTNFLNVDPAAPAFLPQSPFVWRLESVGVPGYQTVKVVGESDSTLAKKLVTDAVGRIAATSYNISSTAVEFVAWEEHDNLQLNVAPEAIRDGFYQDLYALQGRRSTYWTGNAWCSDYSPLLWAFTENRILPLL
ncbi:amine oxidase-like protein [Pseudomassariella vexata]|uniref:Amine oxidase-like protein n=1 Tax=Pseudomassariella vexata TaxID=1141098 RepID=A0A1Y2DXK3_9PEZI|nr:amine oxidase-like protein [Pseudomassariella vexata]ORY63844.1 amine oxidase-like protein [Pseudomassariella vexata]